MTLIPLNSGSRPLATQAIAIDTAGTPERLTAQRCKRVRIQCSPSESDNAFLVVGGADVDALSTPVVGQILYPTQAEWFQCQDASEIYVDASVSGLTGSAHPEG